MMKWLRFLLCFCVFGIFLTFNFWLVSAQAPTKPKIVFVSTRDANSEIYVMNSDSKNLKNLTNHPSIDTAPCWSPDGKQIAFASSRDRDVNPPGADNFEIYVMDSDGKNVRRLTHHPAKDSAPCWSPDGKQIAFASSRDVVGKIYVMNSDGTNLRKLTQNPKTSDWSPDWSPDGKYIVFSSLHLDNMKTDVYVMDSDGRNVRKLTDPPTIDDTSPRWSPDGGRIAFWSDWDGGSDIYIMDADGRDLRRITTHPQHDLHPSWSSDGKQIVFTSYRDGNPEIYVMDSDGKNLRRLTDHPQTDEYPRWFDPAYALSVSRAGKLPSTWGRWKVMPW